MHPAVPSAKFKPANPLPFVPQLFELIDIEFIHFVIETDFENDAAAGTADTTDL